MMKCKPLVRSDSAPSTSANSPLTTIAPRSRDQKLIGAGNEAEKCVIAMKVVIEDADHIAADPEIGGVAEADHAAVAENEIQARGRDARR